jgi:hypothetical protein
MWLIKAKFDVDPRTERESRGGAHPLVWLGSHALSLYLSASPTLLVSARALPTIVQVRKYFLWIGLCKI